MNTQKARLRNEIGTSLIELMVALVLTGIITAAVMSVYFTQHQNYDVQDDVAGIQQSARASIDELTRQIRLAGLDLPVGIPALVAANTDPDTVTINYYASGCETYLNHAMPQPSAELRCGSDVSCFEDGQWVYIFHPDSAGGEWFEITHAQTGSNHIQHNTMVLSQSYDEDAIIMGIDQVKFFVDNTTDDGVPVLMMQRWGKTPQPYARNISDLELVYRLANGTLVDQPVLMTDVREVLIEVTSQSSHVLNGENGSPERGRVYASSVNVRNLSN